MNKIEILWVPTKQLAERWLPLPCGVGAFPLLAANVRGASTCLPGGAESARPRHDG